MRRTPILLQRTPILLRRTPILLSALGGLGLTACALVGPAVPVIVTPGGTPQPQASVRDVFADLRSPSPTPAGAMNPAASTPPAAPVRIVRTDRPLDVAIAGPGYLVVAARPDPRDWADVAFTRDGALGLEFVQAASPQPGAVGFPITGPGEWTLRTRDGRWVLGFELAQDPDRYAPPEGRSTAFSQAFALGGVAGGGAALGPLRLETAAGLAPEAWLDFRGRLTIAGQPPADADGRARFLYLAVAQVELPGRLAIAPDGDRRYDPEAGLVEVGIAGLAARRGEAPRPVGDANLVMPGELELQPGR